MNMMDQIENLYGALQGRYFGKYPGTVVSNADDLNRGRLLVRVPDVLKDQEVWARACVPYAGKKQGGKQTGLFAVPPNESAIWVEFLGGDSSKPVWVGCQWADGQTDASEAEPGTVILRNGAGHVRMTESPAQIVFEAADGSTITIGEGGITLEATEISFTANGATVKVSASGLDALGGALTVT